MKRRAWNRSLTLQCVLIAMTISVSLCPPAAAETIEIVTEDLPPFQIVEKGTVGGMTTEIVTTAARAANLEYTLKAYPWSRAYQMALHKRNVCIYSIARVKKRETLFRWAGKLVQIRNHFYKLAGRGDVAVNSLEDARRYNTVVIRDDAAHHFLVSRRFTENQNVYLTNDHVSRFTMLLAGGGISLLINDNMTLPYRLQEAGVDPDRLERLFEIPELHTDLHVAFSLLTPIHTVHRFSAALEKMKKDGRFERILQKWQPD